MSVNPEALQKVLLEMDSQLNKTRAELSMVNLQLDRVDTNLGMISSTSRNLKKLASDDEAVWQGVGKAFVKTDVSTYLGSIATDEKDFLETQKGLKTKQHYLETTLNNTVKSMAQLVGPKSQ